ncbi:putative 1-deoxy-D-xylulose-5-phosphate synthase 2 [Citrus sinensis]|uniref:Transketolase-like pyrimidine-binding domain-containing protein n=1 Tax=Citrus clementina TaxID=85681 RepID=V4UKL6_CITCL|nr:hypothetical protein CICLE_v10009166mg [Citrus x clementina]KAH9654061.1 putative 1-deoxy-D-xylulose-5-phosphate synthase 2 [Citrus sinensis]
MSYEAIINAGFHKTNHIIILNDNQQVPLPTATIDGPASLAGALNKALKRLHSNPQFRQLCQEAFSSKDKKQKFGGQMHEIDAFSREIEAGSRACFFEDLGLYYIGPVDGHNLEDLAYVLKQVKAIPDPGAVLIHVITEKEKAMLPLKLQQTRLFCKILDNRMGGGTGLNLFQKHFPIRCFDVGIAEQHAVTFAAGLAAEGLKPFCAIYSSFLQRCFDQVAHDVDLQKLPVRFAIDRAGLVGADGPTHCGAFDTTFMACLPNMVVMKDIKLVLL